MDFICRVLRITDTNVGSWRVLLSHIYWSSRNRNLLCADYDRVYMEIGRASCRERVEKSDQEETQAEDGIRDGRVTGVQTCALPIFNPAYNQRRRLHLLH